MGRSAVRHPLPIAVTAALIAALAVPGSARATTFGVNAQKLVFEQPPAAWGRHFDGMARAGLQAVRVDALWEVAEPQPPAGGRRRYRWERFDALVEGLARRRIAWLPVVGYSTRWAGRVPGNHRSPPRDVRDYARFARAVARRYGRGGDFWRRNPRLPRVPVTRYEIWNEPNFRGTAYPPEEYAHLYAAARQAIRSVDPRAAVWVGGLVDRAPAFLIAMYAERPELRGAVDGVAVHPYAEEIAGVLRKVVNVRRTLEHLRDPGVPISITEVGWATAGESPVPRAPDAVRARRLALLAEVFVLSDCGVEAFLPHTWVTAERDRRDSEHWFGLVRPGGQPGASAVAYAGAVRRAGRWRAGEVRRIPLCAG